MLSAILSNKNKILLAVLQLKKQNIISCSTAESKVCKNSHMAFITTEIQVLAPCRHFNIISLHNQF
jgi:azurin